MGATSSSVDLALSMGPAMGVLGFRGGGAEESGAKPDVGARPGFSAAE